MKRRVATPEPTRKAVLKLLASGRASLPEVAALLDLSTHQIWNWCREADLDWRDKRRRHVYGEWKKFEP
jgi:hypothetical protein